MISLYMNTKFYLQLNNKGEVMSGSSSSSRPSFSGGGLVENPSPDCSNLRLSTKVISPTMSYFSKAVVRSTLEVQLDNSIVELLDYSGNVVGSICPTWIERLIKCLEDGHKYQAEIETLNGANIDVLIKHI